MCVQGLEPRIAEEPQRHRPKRAKEEEQRKKSRDRHSRGTKRVSDHAAEAEEEVVRDGVKSVCDACKRGN